MKHFTHYITRLIGVFAMLLACNITAVAEETLFYTFATEKNASNTNYASTYNVTIDSMKWSVPGNQDFSGYVRIGGKSLDKVDRFIYSKTAMGSAINKIVINHGGKSNGSLTVHSIKLYVANNASFTNATEMTLTPSIATSTAGTVEFTGNWATGSYYKFAINVTNSNTSSNYGLDIKSIQFFNDGSIPPSVVAPTFSIPAGTYTSAQDVELSCETPGATIFYTTDGSDPTEAEDVFEYTGTPIHVASTTTIKAYAQTDDDMSNVVEATYTIDIPAPDLYAVYDFVDWNFPGADSGWGAYAEKTVTYDDATIWFKSVSKQGSGMSITDCPVTKGGGIKLTLKNLNYDITKLSVHFEQWGNKAQTVTLYTSTNGENFTKTSHTSDKFKLENISLPAGIKAVMFTFSSTNIQIGLRDIQIDYGPAVTIGSTGFSTIYYSDKNLVVPEGVSAWTYSLNGDALQATESYPASTTIPAGEGVVLYTTAPATYTFNFAETAGDKVAGNLLKGSDEATTKVAEADGNQLYRLAKGSVGVAFYLASQEGNSIAISAHKAYLEIPADATANIREFIMLPGQDDGTTAISAPNAATTATETFDLAGRRISHATKGLYIINGKKVIK